MSRLSKLLIVVILVATAGIASAQQYGIGRYERAQVLSNDLMDATRMLYLREERQWPRYRGDSNMLRVLYRLRQQATNFNHQLQRNFDDRDRINLEYRRLVSTVREAQYMLNRMPYGYFYEDMRVVTSLVNQVGRTLYPDRAYRDGRDYDRDYDRDRDEDFDDYDYED